MFCPHYLLPKVPSRRADPSQPGARGRVQSCPSREPGWQRRHPLLLERRTRLEASKLPARYLHDWEAPARGECQNLRGHRRMAECRIQLKAWTHSCSLERASGSNHLSVRDPRRLESPILAVAAHVRSDVDPRKTAVLRRLVIRLLLRGGGAFVVQYMTGLVVQLWAPIDGHYPEVAYQTAFAINVGLQIAATIWFARTWISTRRVSTAKDGLDTFTLKSPRAFELGVRRHSLSRRSQIRWWSLKSRPPVRGSASRP